MKFKFKENSNIILVSLLLFCSLFLTSRSTVIIFFFIEIFAAIYILKNKRKFQLNIFLVWYILFSGVLCLYGLLTPYEGWFSLAYFCIITLSMLEVYLLFDVSNHEFYTKVIMCIKYTTYLCACLLLSRELPILISKFSLIVQGKSWFRLGIASNVNPTAIAYFFGLLSNFLIYHLIKFKDKNIVFPILLQVLIVILSGSKKGIILLFIPMLIFAIKNCIKQPKNIIKYLLYFLLIMLLIMNIPFLYNMIGYRIIDFFQTFGFNFLSNHSIYSEVDKSTLLRIDMIEKAYELFTKHIFFGNGWNAFSALSEYRYYSHCNYLELLSSMGIFGFTIYYSIYGFIISKLNKEKKNKHIILIISLITSLLISDFSSITMYDTLINYFVIFIVCKFIFTRTDTLVTIKHKKGVNI